MLNAYILWLRNKNRELSTSRLKICSGCPCFHNLLMVCSICGCAMAAKTRDPKEKCPINKW